MAEDPRMPTPPQVNRARTQGLGVGQKELNLQKDPARSEDATDPERLEPFEPDTRDDAEASGEDRSFAADDGDAAEPEDDPMLGAGAPANVNPHDLGQRDNPQEDWGEPAGEGVTHSQTHTRRPLRTEAERGQGAKTRKLNKDIISRRT
ncbi:hypothetical protein DJ021_07665 [Phenylobacterium hankyongense]|uniref:Uncharacterized protein n=1 Tax=Phenylobacterium hankyongense TaxID=1813876 RepID=A0A328B196_9CAUL|nr:hypothetical protein [Phenylobacterium hankyongense]RAK59686.1 hypothetical protein DJ021_07665 [Phenylobacterium hankyongense]